MCLLCSALLWPGFWVILVPLSPLNRLYPALIILHLLQRGYIRHTWHTFTPELWPRCLGRQMSAVRESLLDWGRYHRPSGYMLLHRTVCLVLCAESAFVRTRVCKGVGITVGDKKDGRERAFGSARPSLAWFLCVACSNFKAQSFLLVLLAFGKSRALTFSPNVPCSTYSRLWVGTM